MKNKTRKTKPNLVILCEGSETENYYFSDIVSYISKNDLLSTYSDIRIIPEPIVDGSYNPIRGKKRKMNKPPFSYIYMNEENQEDYDKYKAQPLRYVREIELMMKKEGVTEGWVVFDKDKHPSHKEAFEHAHSVNVQIAFSSYSFETWFLAHFERNVTAYTKSDCKNEKGKSNMCGNNVVNDCHGTICIAGRLREMKYIEDFKKNQKNFFENYTLPNIKQTLINAAWYHSLSNDPIYLRNPYTDVDKLVRTLLNIKEEYQWQKIGNSFIFNKSLIIINNLGIELEICNLSDKYEIFNSYNIFGCDYNGKIIAPLTENPLQLQPYGRIFVPTRLIYKSLLLINGYNNYYIEL